MDPRKRTCVIWLGDFSVTPQSWLSPLPPCFMSSYVSPVCIRHTSTTQPLSHSGPFPQLCLSHTCTPIHQMYVHTHTPSPLDHVGDTVALNLSYSALHQSPVKTTNPQHTPPSLCMQAFPWQLWCGGSCLATTRLSCLPILLYGMGVGVWVGWRLIVG